MPAKTSRSRQPVRKYKDQDRAYQELCDEVDASVTRRQIDRAVARFVDRYDTDVLRATELAAAEQLNFSNPVSKIVYAAGALSSRLAKEVRRRY